jgi:dihydroxy-acid dehydratase
MVGDVIIQRRRDALTAKFGQGWRPASRDRKVSPALQAYAAMTTSAARGAVRDVGQLRKD